MRFRPSFSRIRFTRTDSPTSGSSSSAPARVPTTSTAASPQSGSPAKAGHYALKTLRTQIAIEDCGAAEAAARHQGIAGNIADARPAEPRIQTRGVAVGHGVED